MTCQPTQIPPPSSFEIPALREKFLYERDKRLNMDATAQYVRAIGQFEETYGTDPHMPVQPRDEGKLRFYAGEPYGLGWQAFEDLL